MQWEYHVCWIESTSPEVIEDLLMRHKAPERWELVAVHSMPDQIPGAMYYFKRPVLR